MRGQKIGESLIKVSGQKSPAGNKGWNDRLAAGNLGNRGEIGNRVRWARGARWATQTLQMGGKRGETQEWQEVTKMVKSERCHIPLLAS